MMKCTNCGKGTLEPAYLDSLFPCHTCNHCGGNFVHLHNYLSWLEKSPGQPSADEVVAEDSTKALICPQTGSIMTKYRISKNSDHKLDLSPSINAIWLDKGEWELIKAEGLAMQLNAVFTDAWQRKIRDGKTEETLKGMYEKDFGRLYPQIQSFRELIKDQKNKAEIIAYLVSDDPYKV